MNTAAQQENAALKARLAVLEGAMSGMTREIPVAERDALAEAQTRADAIAGLFGERALPPLPGETSLRYRQRLAASLQKHSPRFASARLDRLDSATLAGVEAEIFEDARTTAFTGQDQPMRLTAISERDSAGRLVTRFTGDMMTWLSAYMGSSAVGRFNRPAAE